MFFAVFLTMLLSACVINTGGQQKASNNPQVPAQAEKPTRQNKVSLEEAAQFNMTLGANYLKQNNLTQAIAKLEKAVEQDPKLALAHTYLGFAFEQFGELDKAETHYSRAVRLDSNDPISLNNYGTFLCRNDQVKKSLKYFEKAANNRRYQTPDAALANAGVCAKKIESYATADKYFRDAININPKQKDYFYHLTEVNIKLNKLVAAKDYFETYEKIVLNEKETPDYLYLAYRLNKALDNPGQAGSFALRLQQDFPNSPQTKEFLERRK